MVITCRKKNIDLSLLESYQTEEKTELKKRKEGNFKGERKWWYGSFDQACVLIKKQIKPWKF